MVGRKGYQKNVEMKVLFLKKIQKIKVLQGVIQQAFFKKKTQSCRKDSEKRRVELTDAE